MKKILIVVVLAIAALVAYNYATTGKVTLVPSRAASSEDRELRDLGQRLEAAKQQFAQAGRSAGISGMDTTGDVEAVQASVRQIRKDLDSLKSRLTSKSSLDEAAELARRIEEFSAQLR